MSVSIVIVMTRLMRKQTMSQDCRCVLRSSNHHPYVMRVVQVAINATVGGSSYALGVRFVQFPIDAAASGPLRMCSARASMSLHGSGAGFMGGAYECFVSFRGMLLWG